MRVAYKICSIIIGLSGAFGFICFSSVFFTRVLFTLIICAALLGYNLGTHKTGKVGLWALIIINTLILFCSIVIVAMLLYTNLIKFSIYILIFSLVPACILYVGAVKELKRMAHLTNRSS